MKKLYIHQFPITPVLSVLLPIAYLANANITQINLDDITRSIYVSCAAAVVLLMLGWAIFRNIYKSAVVVTVGLLLFFSYGHFYHFIHGARWIIGRHRILIPLMGLFVLAISVVLFRSERNIRELVGYTNIILLVLFLYSAIPAGTEFYKYFNARAIRREKIREMEVAEGVGAVKPDIYYIVLDMYARADVLKDVYGYDNSGFLNDLKKMGFYVVDCSQSNYQQTMYSLNSTLNADYISEIPEPGSDKTTFSSVVRFQRENLVNGKARLILESQGYTTIAFQTGYGFSEWDDADIYYSLDNELSSINDFETMLLNTTMVYAYNDVNAAKPEVEEDINWEDYDESPEYRYKIKTNDLIALDNITDVPGPKFIFAHLPLPHGPFVFDENGLWTGGRLSEEEGYIPQLIYTNKRMLSIMAKIIRNSDTPPIIMLASDHGIDETNPDIRMKNLMAYYVPDEMRVKLYPTITPVNSFRLVLTGLGYADMPLLKDYSFFSGEMEKEPYHIVENNCPINK